VDFNGEPKQAEDGQLWTPGAVDFFRIVNEQVTVVEEVSNGEMLLRTGEAVMAIMRDFQV
jgi:exocyst complex component 3